MKTLTASALLTTLLATGVFVAKRPQAPELFAGGAVMTVAGPKEFIPRSGDPIEAAYARGLEAEANGDHRQAFEAFRSAAVRYPDGQAQSSINFVQRLRKYALAAATVGHVGDAERILERALEENAKSRQPGQGLYAVEASIQIDLARLALASDNLDQAEIHASQAAAGAERLPIEATKRANNLVQLESVGALDVLSEVYDRQGRLNDAIAASEQALILDKRFSGSLSPTVGKRLERLAGYVERTGDTARALALTEQSLIIAELDSNVSRDELVNNLNNLAEAYRRSGQFTLAAPLYAKAVGIADAVHGKGSKQAALPLYNQGLLAQSQSDFGTAEVNFRQALDILNRTAGRSHPATQRVLRSTEKLLKSQGRLREAETLAEKFAAKT